MARARVMVRRGRGALAERLVREAVSLAEQTDSTDLRATALLDAADVRRQAGRPAEAEPFEKRALRLFERRGATAQAAMVPGFNTHEGARAGSRVGGPRDCGRSRPQPVERTPGGRKRGDRHARGRRDAGARRGNEPTAPIEMALQEQPTEPPAQPESAAEPEAAAGEPAPQSDTFFANGSAGAQPG